MSDMHVCLSVRRMYVAVNGSLIITSISDNDSAVYQCFAVNDVGETSATMLLTVFGMYSLCCLLLFFDPSSSSVITPDKSVTLFFVHFITAGNS